MRSRIAQNPMRAAWLLGALALVVYLVTLAHGVTWDDSGELAAGVAQLGVVHPTGYPTYVLLGYVFTELIPFGDPATQANAWSAVCAAAAIALAARYVIVRGGSLVGAAVAAILLTVAPVLWYQATVASAYPFLMLSIALLITAGDAWVRRPTTTRLALFAVTIGLVLLAHKTGIFFAAGAAGVMVLNREHLDRRSVLPLLAILIPLATMFYIPLRQNWDGWPNLIGADGIIGRHNLVAWITGTAQNITEADTLGANKYAMRIHSERFVVMMLTSLSPAALLLVPAAFRNLWRDRSYILCGVVPSVISSVIILTTPGAFAYRHVGILLVGAIACGVGVEPALEWLRGKRLAIAVAAVTLLIPVAAGVYYLQRSHREAGTWARSTLAAMPRNGTILASWTALAPLRGVQALDHYRRDVTVLEAPGDPWDTGDWYKHPHAWAVAIQENRDPVPGTEQVVPTVGLNIKGLSGLVMGPIRVGYPLAWARTLRPTGTVRFKPPQ